MHTYFDIFTCSTLSKSGDVTSTKLVLVSSQFQNGWTKFFHFCDFAFPGGLPICTILAIFGFVHKKKSKSTLVLGVSCALRRALLKTKPHWCQLSKNILFLKKIELHNFG